MAVSKEIQKAAEKAAEGEKFWNANRDIILVALGAGVFLGLICGWWLF